MWVAGLDPAVPVVEDESRVVCIALACRYERVIYSRGLDTADQDTEKSGKARN